MRWTLAKAGLAFLTAGTLGLARPSLAQQSPYLPAGTPTPMGKVRTEAHPYAVVKQHQAMLEEVKVELAWLADPATFPCRLGAFQEEENLKIRGFVPNEAVKMRAMEIAAQHTAMPLIDELRIYSNIPMPAVGVPVDSVLADAAQVLVKALGDKANPLELTASASGQIVVTGTLSTLADQLAVSRCLCGVHGCTSVKNLVTVPSFKTASSVSSKPSAEKKVEAATSPKMVTVPEAKASTSKMATLPETITKTPKMVVTPEVKTNSPKMAMTPEPKAIPSKAETMPDATASSMPTSTGTEISKFKTLKGTKADVSKDTAKTITLPPSAETAKPSQPVIINKTSDTSKVSSASGPTLVLPPASRSVVAPLPVANQPLGGGERSKTTSDTQTTAFVVAPLSEANEPISAGERKKTPTPERKSTSTDASTVITADARMKDKPSKKVEPVSHATSIQAAMPSGLPEGAYVASGVITYEEAPAKSAPVARTDPSIAHLKDRIQSICGNVGKNVELHASTGNRLTIRVQCATREEGERLSKRILEMPQLAPYEVSLDVKLVP